MAVRVDLIVPGLFHLPVYELDPVFLSEKLPALNHILRFGQRESNRLTGFESILADLLGFSPDQPIAFANAFAGTNNAGTGDGQHLLAQATHLKADMRNAFVVPLDQSIQTQQDVSRVVEDMSTVFEADCHFEALEQGLYLMTLKQCRAPQDFPHYLSVLGRKVDQYIKQSREYLPWYQLINEMQMFMHTHEVNQRRLSEGGLPINSLWCWGNGESVTPTPPVAEWFCDDSLLKAYADKNAITHKPIEQLQTTVFDKDTIVIDLDLLQILKSAHEADLQSQLASQEANLFSPLIRAVKAGRVKLRVRAGFDHDLIVSKLFGLKFWRSKQNLLDHLS